MAYDDVLAARVRDLAGPDLRERSVFGARCWLLDGNMAFGVTDEDLLVRLGDSDEASGLRGFDPMESGKPMRGWYLVDGDEVAEDGELLEWMGRATAFAAQLPPK